MTVEIVPAREEDFADIARLLRDCGLPPDGLYDHLATALVARDGHEIVGSAALEIYGEGALLRSVAVARPLQHSGLGRRLTDAAIALARAQRVPALYLLTTTAGEYFPRFGFERIQRSDVPDGVKRSIEFSSVCCASAIVMRKTL